MIRPFSRFGSALLLLGLLAPARLLKANEGDLDPFFGAVTGGRVLTNLNGSSDIAWAIALQDDGRVVVAGSTHSGADFVVARYNVDGTLDTAFGTGGSTVTDFSGGNDSASAVAIQAEELPLDIPFAPVVPYALPKNFGGHDEPAFG